MNTIRVSLTSFAHWWRRAVPANRALRVLKVLRALRVLKARKETTEPA